MLIPIMKHPHSGVVFLAWTELQSQGDAFGWVSERCLRHVGARFVNEKSLGYQWSRLQLEPGIVWGCDHNGKHQNKSKEFQVDTQGPWPWRQKGSRNFGQKNFGLNFRSLNCTIVIAESLARALAAIRFTSESYRSDSNH